ncbi:MAG TPA: septal ring lytic transglycosylase RlpA family protein [Candidatus Omnitrophota bacterium]|nr:septal ring lytic transglycosylase RlpA family protein [Candidatus Omnitrophota bacterium]
MLKKSTLFILLSLWLSCWTFLANSTATQEAFQPKKDYNFTTKKELALLEEKSGIKANRDSSLVGKAAWYSKNDPTDPFKHKFNADGSRFDENALTCAMRSRDFGKYYKVTNTQNGRSVIVRHRDFGPAQKYKGRKLNRVMDLTRAAFQEIADLDIGVIQVEIEEIGGES